MLSFKEFFGFDNPFRLTPEEKERLWADQQKLKEELENIIKISLLTSPTKLVVYYGDWGSGKTHAMRYFTNKDNLESLLKSTNLNPPITIPLISPRNRVFDTFYIKIMENLYPKIAEVVIEISKKIGETVRDPKLLKDKLNKYIENKNLIKALSQLINTRKKFLVEKFFFLTVRGNELDKLGIPRGIETYTDKIEVLSNVFLLLTEENKTRIIIWIDEGENVFNMPSKDLLEFQTFLRDLVDHMPKNLLILINASLRRGEKIQDFLEYLGDPIQTRINKLIYSPELKPKEAIQYVEDYFKTTRKSPFSKEIIRAIVNIISKESKERGMALTPRIINVAFSNILEMAYLRSKKRITKEFINSIKDDLVFATFSYPSTQSLL